MKKIFLSFLFILFFNLVISAQIVEPTPIVVNENTAVENTVTGNEFSLGRLIIDVASDGSFSNSRITVVASIGKRLESTDNFTNFKLFNKIAETEIFSGTLAAYSQELDQAVANNVITAEQKLAIMQGLVDIYVRCFEGFKRTVTVLDGNNKLELKAKKVAK